MSCDKGKRISAPHLESVGVCPASTSNGTYNKHSSKVAPRKLTLCSVCNKRYIPSKLAHLCTSPMQKANTLDKLESHLALWGIKGISHTYASDIFDEAEKTGVVSMKNPYAPDAPPVSVNFDDVPEWLGRGYHATCWPGYDTANVQTYEAKTPYGFIKTLTPPSELGMEPALNARVEEWAKRPDVERRLAALAGHPPDKRIAPIDLSTPPIPAMPDHVQPVLNDYAPPSPASPKRLYSPPTPAEDQLAQWEKWAVDPNLPPPRNRPKLSPIDTAAYNKFFSP
jgi:hypothetical protein